MSRETVCKSIDVEGDRRISVEIDRGWEDVDAALRTLARRRAALDAEEARWLRAAAQLKIWRELGFVSMLDYLEHRLGYAPRTAYDRLRVALALGELPAMEQAMADGMPFSAIRELTRVATPDTEKEWLDECRGKTVHEIEQRVSGRQRGASPKDPARPDLATRPLTFEQLKPTTIGLVREARAKAQAERGHHLADDELLAMLCGAFLEGNAAEPSGARYSVAVTICECCNQGWRDARGRRCAMDRSEVERALCDAQHLGPLDEPRARAVQDIPPRTRRLVWRRDGGRCRTPGCRSAAHLELHHIIGRARGGTHEAENLIVLCDGCHSAHHRGLIEIRGTSSALVVERVGFAKADHGAIDDGDVAVAPIDRDLTSYLPPADEPASLGDLESREASSARVGTNGRHSPTSHVAAVSGARGAARQQPSAEPTSGSSAHAGTSSSAPRRGTPSDAGTNTSSPQPPHVIAKHAPPLSRSSSREAPLGPSRFEIETMRADARAALVGLGFRRSEAATAVDHALTKLGSAATLEAVIREALRSSATVKPTAPTR